MAQEKVCAVAVTYNPDPVVLRALLDAIIPQVGGVVVVDNGSATPPVAMVAEAGGVLMALGENLGVAAGFNRGIAWAEEHGFDQVLLLDQDSCPAPEMVARLCAAYGQLTARGERVAAVGPVACDPHSGHEVGFARLGGVRFRYLGGAGAETPVMADFLISSGSLLPLAVVRMIGGMDEGLFIDLVDTEWFLRARMEGMQAFGVGAAVLQHAVGEKNVGVRLGGHQLGSLSHHAPLRHYYIFRNSMLLNKRPYVPRRWVLNNAVQLAGMFVYFGLLAPPRRQHLRMMVKGMLDGVLGRTGPYGGEVA